MDLAEAIGEHNQKHESIGELRANHDALKDRVDRIELSFKSNLERIYEKLDRPSWVVTVVITLLSSLCVALIVLALKGH